MQKIKRRLNRSSFEGLALTTFDDDVYLEMSKVGSDSHPRIFIGNHRNNYLFDGGIANTSILVERVSGLPVSLGATDQDAQPIFHLVFISSAFNDKEIVEIQLSHSNLMTFLYHLYCLGEYKFDVTHYVHAILRNLKPKFTLFEWESKTQFLTFSPKNGTFGFHLSGLKKPDLVVSSIDFEKVEVFEEGEDHLCSYKFCDSEFAQTNFLVDGENLPLLLPFLDSCVVLKAILDRYSF